MARKPTPRSDSVLFNVVYVDGSLSSKRKVPASLVGALEGDAPVKDSFESQDRELAERSGQPRAAIKAIS